jgi:hypothetical protein
VSLDLARRGSVEGGREQENDKQWSQSDGVVVIVRDDEDEDTASSS